MNFVITGQNVNQRLDKFLGQEKIKTSQGHLFSRGQIQKLISHGQVTVNQKLVKSHYRLKDNDSINLSPNFFKDKTKDEQTAPALRLASWPLKIIKETSGFLVINKPAGLAVQNHQTATLVNILLAKFPSLKKIGDDPARPGLVHRLDKEVSGLMVIAKNQASFDNLKQQFQQRIIIKEYTALVYGKIKAAYGLISFPIERSKKGYLMAALPKTEKGQPNLVGRQAITEFQVIKNFHNFTLVKVKIKTGRTHQIRVHFKALAHPIVGDNLYGSSKTRLFNKKYNLGRIFLVADKLSFTDLTGARHAFSLRLPLALKNFLKKIK